MTDHDETAFDQMSIDDAVSTIVIDDLDDARKYDELRWLFDVIKAPGKQFVFRDKDHWFISFP